MVIDTKDRIYRALKKNRQVPPCDPFIEKSTAEDVKAAHPKNHTTELSSGIKANHPRLRDGCSGQRVKTENIRVFFIPRQCYLIDRERGFCCAQLVIKKPRSSTSFFIFWEFGED
ncbi:hypothetical protein TNCT_430021 [Trichonephila clavata]|uniref:Uncharacterized protein n=1 Tax=Trichonephila clavata TaxID=2740835 RepID=A0A8X6G0K7_TRICU|nr:hypothetical protein TNCT_430021 [Trichonephila clavata]